MRYVNKSVALVAVLAIATLLGIPAAFAQRDAGAKIRGEYNYHGSAASRSMQGARGYARDYRQYVRTAPGQKVEPEIAKETADAIGDYLTKAQKHMAWMRKQATASNDKAALTSLDSIDKNLAAAKQHHESLCEYCEKENVEAKGSMECCQEIDASLAAAIAEHDKLMKRLAGDKPATK
jgi:hypothetical protein